MLHLPTFAGFKNGPGADIIRMFEIPIDRCLNWDDLQETFVRANEYGALTDEARRLDGVLSSGQRIVLHAVLHACDFDWLADELAHGRSWDRFSSVGGQYLDAAVACIARRNSQPSMTKQEYQDELFRYHASMRDRMVENDPIPGPWSEDEYEMSADDWNRFVDAPHVI